MIEDCTAVILTGGGSERMGQDKASLELGGGTLLQSVSVRIRELFSEVLVSVRQLRKGTDLPQVCDVMVDAGPLAGLTASFERAKTSWVYLVACDMPFLETEVIELLASKRKQCQAVVAIIDGQPQPLAGFYAKECAVVAGEILAGSGKHSMRALLSKLEVCYVGEEELRSVDSELRSFIDLDTPEDVAAVLNGVN